jgi:hypothetical protein
VCNLLLFAQVAAELHRFLLSHGVRCFWDVAADASEELGGRIERVYKTAPITILIVGSETQFRPSNERDYIRDECRAALRASNRLVLVQAEDDGPCDSCAASIIEELQNSHNAPESGSTGSDYDRSKLEIELVSFADGGSSLLDVIGRPPAAYCTKNPCRLK